MSDIEGKAASIAASQSLSTKMFPPDIASALAKNDVAVLEPFFNKLQENTTQRSILGRGKWVHGAATPWEYFKMFQAYSLADIARNIRCPTFVDEAENDRRRQGFVQRIKVSQRIRALCGG